MTYIMSFVKAKTFFKDLLTLLQKTKKKLLEIQFHEKLVKVVLDMV